MSFHPLPVWYIWITKDEESEKTKIRRDFGTRVDPVSLGTELHTQQQLPDRAVYLVLPHISRIILVRGATRAPHCMLFSHIVATISLLSHSLSSLTILLLSLNLCTREETRENTRRYNESSSVRCVHYIFYMVRQVNFELVKLVRLVKNLELKKRHFGRQKSCVRGVFA
jgi:hypothetical protein